MSRIRLFRQYALSGLLILGCQRGEDVGVAAKGPEPILRPRIEDGPRLFESMAGTGELRLDVRSQKGLPLEHSVYIDDEFVIVGKGESIIEGVLFGKRHVEVRSIDPAFGGLGWDLDLRDQFSSINVVLLPGPDRVRLPGYGSFTPGTAPNQPSGEHASCFAKPYYKVTVLPFEIDRTEVTVAQWKACRGAGGCTRDKRWASTTVSVPGDCHVDVQDLEETVRAGREHHAMNCVAQWQAEDYCRWAGKRLPMDVEWEYAARSGKNSNRFPWGSDYGPCMNKATADDACVFRLEEDPKYQPPCAYPALNTEQGVCDMAGNLYEIVMYQDFPGRPPREECESWDATVYPQYLQYIIGSVGTSVAECTMSIPGMWGRWSQAPWIGFRCVRDVE